MCSNEFSCVRRGMVPGIEKAGDFYLKQMDSDRVSEYNHRLQQHNFAVIRWLEEQEAPQELIIQAIEDAAQGNNAILSVYDEIVMGGKDYVVIPAKAMKQLLETMDPLARALFIQLCKEYA